MFAVNGKEALVYFKNAFYAAKLNDAKNHVSIDYKKFNCLNLNVLISKV
ncbi:hypothetical protein M1558_01300 [Candidatus Parvarchaeota archaeon]|nr:hypothetical protein [Candidatus Parvarchaeota archaeon]